MNKQKYYITDLSGSLSRNIMDSMLFFNEFSAESYAGTVEHLIEEVTGLIATVRVLSRRYLALFRKHFPNAYRALEIIINASRVD